MTTYQKFKKLKIDFQAIGFEPISDDFKYFCTPIGAHIIGRAGVDGIHYCTVRGQGEMVYSVNPSNEIGKNVFPIADTFDELLSLLLACGSMAAIEQAHQWDEEQFEEFVAENQPTPAQGAVFDVLRDKLGITPMEGPFAYLRRLQDRYDYGMLHFTKEYYESLNALAHDDRPPEWKVTIEGGFRAERGKAGKEITVGKRFDWGDEHWHVPAVYLCSGGLVIDFCVAVDEERLKAYWKKAKKIEEEYTQLTEEEKFQLKMEYPLSVEFHPAVKVNGELLRDKSGSWLYWIPAEWIGEDSWEKRNSRWVLEHYGLDTEKAWVISRHTFPWEDRRNIELQSVRLHLERKEVKIPVVRFKTLCAGDSVRFAHPISGVEHTLTVTEYEAQKVDGDRFHNEDLEFPTHFTAMSYTLDPDLPDDAFMLKDCDEGDRPRPKHPAPRGCFSMSAGVMAVVRSTDGPTSVFLADGRKSQTHAIASSMHFKLLSGPVEWHLIVQEKLLPDIDIVLI